MADSSADADADAVAPLSPVTDIASDGDVILEVTFEHSKETLKAARKRNSVLNRHPPSSVPSLKRSVKVAYRVSSNILKKQSSYFARLLGDSRFEEARAVQQGLNSLSLRNLKPAQADAQDLP